MTPKFLSALLVSILFFAHCSALASDKAVFGEVHFKNSCKQSVQADLQQAIALLHSFEFSEATKQFHVVENQDPSCSIAAWGVALSNLERQGASRPLPYLASGWKELQPWLSRPSGSRREGMYLSAVSKLYENCDHATSEDRGRAYVAAMRQVHSTYPNDVDAALFYALALEESAGPENRGLQLRRQALDILLPIFQTHPNHPGVAHYIIHSADTPELAALALPAARKYAAIAPASPHALHMPSHIFSRLGYWQESINTNLASARVAAEWVSKGKDGRFDEQHALNHIEYAFLQLGEDRSARQQIDKIALLMGGPDGDPWGVIDARIYYDLEVHDWKDALQISPPAHSPFPENLDVYWIHTIAAGHLGKANDAAGALDEFKRSSQEFEKQHGWGDLIHLELLQAEAWTLFSQDEHQRAVVTLREAMSFERSHPQYYPDVLPRPSAEFLGDMLLRLHSYHAATQAYHDALVFAPKRLNSLIGAYNAAMAGHDAKLTAYYTAIVSAECKNSDRKEIAAVLAAK